MNATDMITESGEGDLPFELINRPGKRPSKWDALRTKLDKCLPGHSFWVKIHDPEGKGPEDHRKLGAAASTNLYDYSKRNNIPMSVTLGTAEDGDCVVIVKRKPIA